MPIDFNKIESLKKKIKKDKEKNSDSKSKLLKKDASFSVHTKSKAQHLDKEVQAIGLKGVQDLITYAPSKDDKNNQLINLKDQSFFDEELAQEALKLKKLLSNVQMEHQAKQAAGQMGMPVKLCSSYRRFESVAKDYNSVDWASWIPTNFTSFTWDELELPYNLASMFPSFNMTSLKEDIPLHAGYYEGMLESETGTFEEQSTDVDTVQAESKNNVVHAAFWQDLLEDNIDPQLFEKQRFNTAMGIVRSFENAILNGDDSTTHMDASVTNPKDFRRAFKGLRKLAMENSGNGTVVDGGGSTIELSHIQNLIAAGMNESDSQNQKFLMPAEIWKAIASGKIPEILTVQNAGSNATLLSGNIFPLFGIDNYKAPKMPTNLNAAGVNSAIDDLLTALLLIDTSRFVVGNRTGLRFWIGRALPNQDRIYCTAKQRHTFAAPPQNTKEKGVVMLRNLARV